MWTRKELKDMAKSAFKNNYWRSVLAGLILVLATGVVSGATAGGSPDVQESVNNEIQNATSGMDITMIFAIFGIVLSIMGVMLIISVIVRIFLWNPLIVGSLNLYRLNEVEDERPTIKGAFAVLKGNYGRIGGIMFLKDLLISLWSILFLIPGMIKTYQYMMIPYILADNPEVSRKEAFELSKNMMKGNKWKAFVLDLSFIGWYMLTGLTGGILGIFYVSPYVYQTRVELYLVLKDNI